MAKFNLKTLTGWAVLQLREFRRRVVRGRRRSGLDRGHGLHDPHDASKQDGWYPITSEAMQLALCVESCKQINAMRPMLMDGGVPPRNLTVLATPVLNLVENVLRLRNELWKADRSDWPEADRKNFENKPRSLQRAAAGPLRTIRNQRAGHTSAAAFAHGSVPASTPENILRPLGQAAFLLLLCLDHKTAFGYARQPNPTSKDEIEFYFQYPLASRFRLDKGGHPVELLGGHLEADPRHEQGELVCQTVKLYNALVGRDSLLPRIRPR